MQFHLSDNMKVIPIILILFEMRKIILLDQFEKEDPYNLNFRNLRKTIIVFYHIHHDR